MTTPHPTLKLHNTKTRKREVFTPIDPENVRMYVCGPTVYDRAHLGNARPVIVFDVLNRLLRHVYGDDHVTYVRNFTDVDDKINATALARREAGAKGTLEDLIAQRTEETIDWYHADMDAVGALRPDIEPRATQFIGQMRDMIEELIDKGFAYAVPATVGHNSKAHYVYTDSSKMPEHAFLSVDDMEQHKDQVGYGNLSGRSVEDMIAGSRAEVGEGKRNPMDSVLWKPSTIEQPGWESPWGFGRPGWHIECSAMARQLLGKSFDIHGGGLDLLFPHHENELAQCKACDGAEASANYWLHNEMLQVEGKKMSKSLGNFFTVRDLLDQGVPGEVIRFVMLSTHYRKPMDWTEKKARDAKRKLQSWYRILGKAAIGQPDDMVVSHLYDDLNTHAALRRIDELAKNINHNDKFDGQFEAGVPNAPEMTKSSVELREEFRASLALIGLIGDEAPAWVIFDATALSDYEDMLSIARARAMETKDFSEVDRVKTMLSAAGVQVQMSKEGVSLSPDSNFDPSKLEALK